MIFTKNVIGLCALSLCLLTDATPTSTCIANEMMLPHSQQIRPNEFNDAAEMFARIDTNDDQKIQFTELEDIYSVATEVFQLARGDIGQREASIPARIDFRVAEVDDNKIEANILRVSNRQLSKDSFKACGCQFKNSLTMFDFLTLINSEEDINEKYNQEAILQPRDHITSVDVATCILRKRSDMDITNNDIKNMFYAIDTNRDGEIDFEELEEKFSQATEVCQLARGYIDERDASFSAREDLPFVGGRVRIEKNLLRQPNVRLASDAFKACGCQYQNVLSKNDFVNLINSEEDIDEAYNVEAEEEEYQIMMEAEQEPTLAAPEVEVEMTTEELTDEVQSQTNNDNEWEQGLPNLIEGMLEKGFGQSNNEQPDGVEISNINIQVNKK